MEIMHTDVRVSVSVIKAISAGNKSVFDKAGTVHPC